MEQLARGPNLHIETRFERVRALALLAGLGKDPKSGVTAAEAASFADRSVAALRDAIDAGWAVRDGLKEPAFDPLRGREDFQKRVAELEAKHGPKAEPKDGSPRPATSSQRPTASGSPWPSMHHRPPPSRRRAPPIQRHVVSGSAPSRRFTK